LGSRRVHHPLLDLHLLLLVGLVLDCDGTNKNNSASRRFNNLPTHTYRRRKPLSGGGGGGGNASAASGSSTSGGILRFYSEDAEGLQVYVPYRTPPPSLLSSAFLPFLQTTYGGDCGEPGVHQLGHFYAFVGSLLSPGLMVKHMQVGRRRRRRRRRIRIRRNNNALP